MADDPNKRGRDRNTVSQQPWEIETVHQKFPGKSHDAVKRAIDECKRELAGSEDRDKIMACLRRKLG